MLFENNEYYNLHTVSNDFGGHNHVWRGNYMHDFSNGIVIEDKMKDIIIEDNTFTSNFAGDRAGAVDMQAEMELRRNVFMHNRTDANDALNAVVGGGAVAGRNL